MRSSLRLALLIACCALITSVALCGGAALLELPFVPEPTRHWGEDIPAEIAASSLEADHVLDEAPCDWRPMLAAIFRPAVTDCATAREATLHIAANLGNKTGVYYSMERSKPCMNAREALEQKKVSCTGQSILLVCALRSVGIPARAVGVATWNHVRGNHTWVEAWFEGDWHMIEANEKDFNTPWVMEAVGMLNPEARAQRVLAVQAGGQQRFPTVWNPQSGIDAEDVTARYQILARQWHEKNGLPAGCQKLMVDVSPRHLLPRAVLLETAEGKALARATLPTTQDDVRRHATLLLPLKGEYYLRVEGESTRHPVRATETAVQLLRLPHSTNTVRVSP